jgi:hypothetical protein
MKRRISIGEPIPNPTAQICINKSRLKVYNKETSPTYYLEKGQEFQIELFNPTKDTVLAKIQLNGKSISQGGLILKPGQRVFLERYLDVAKKFMFDTYEVSNTEEVKKAIEDNGDFKVEFYKESQNVNFGSNITYTNITYTTQPSTLTIHGTGNYNSCVNLPFAGSLTTSNSGTYNLTDTTVLYNTNNTSRSLETGRVEAGSNSDQKFEYVNKSFDYYAFHTVECKLLPVSQKINTVEDINVKRYCTNCGAKQKPEFKFCPSCGKKC